MGTSSEAGIKRLLALLGFAEPPLELDAMSQRRLGLPDSLLTARVATTPGSLRALSVDIAEDASVQECVESTARRLSICAPQSLWLIVAVQRVSGTLAIAAWRTGGPTLHMCAMVTARAAVLDSDAETLCSLVAATALSGDVMRYLRWLDVLGRDAVTRRFFLALAAATEKMARSLPDNVPVNDRREMALLTTSRLIFLSFLETKGWLNGDFGFLANGFAECAATGGGYQRRVLEPLFFGTLNTRVGERAARARAFGRVPFLNGGLFTRTPVERIHRPSRFTDEAIGALFGDVMVRYRFTAREDTASWSQAAIDPEMLGKVFESLMDSGDRKRGGVFYTPQTLVDRLALLTITNALCKRGLSHDEATHLMTGEHAGNERNPIILALVSNLRVLDPACGSGAFLVHVLERIARLRVSLGEARPLSDVRRSVLTHSIFGVDASATAVWLCELRLWLSVVIDSGESNPMRISPLPNLDRQIRVGDSLSGDAFESANSNGQLSRHIAAMHHRYARATGRRKVALGKRLDFAERERGIAALDRAITRASSERREILNSVRAADLFNHRRAASAVSRDRLLKLRADLRSLRQQRASIVRGGLPAFSYPTHFASVARTGGFDIIIGNPPWVRIHNISPHARAKYREHFTTYRASAWLEGARSARAGSGFAGQVDLAALFLERSVDLLARNGTVGLLLPAKLWRSLAGGGARRLVLERTEIHAIEDHSDGPDIFQAAVYPSMLVAGCVDTDLKRSETVSVSVQRHITVQKWTGKHRDLPLDTTPGSPWLLIPPIARRAFDRITAAGLPLFESIIGRPHLGVKTGCNEAFLVRAAEDDSGLTSVYNDGRHGKIETELLRPLLRGETLERWRVADIRDQIVWTHGSDGAPLRSLPPHAQSWLAHSRRTLERRSDSHCARWWSLFRVEAARFNTARVVWGDFGRTPCAAVIDQGNPVVPLNTCYTVQCERMDDALALCALLNSDVAAAWLAALAEPARGGYHRYLGWTIARLPVPVDWPRARMLLAPVAARARDGNIPSSGELREAVLCAYKLTVDDVSPLLSWTDARQDD